MSGRNFLGSLVRRFSAIPLLIGFLLCSAPLLAQTTVGTGSIVGTVTDQSGAVISGAKVMITNAAGGQTIDLTTNNSGYFNSGALTPGNYNIKVSSQGFSTLSTATSVRVGNTSTVNASLTLGQESQTIEVKASEVQVNTEQAEVQGVLNVTQIQNLPINGRNFLDLAQLEPGVQIQDGQNFDPTKAGYSSISFAGRFGRTARIYVDGVDVSDETVGTTTADIPQSAIDQFQLAQSSLDLSNDLTSSGAVNVTTRSGTNTVHGEAFEQIRDRAFRANPPGGVDIPFQRNQFGGRVGGPIIKDKLFFFLDGERTKQDALSLVNLSGTPYDGFSGGFSQPFRENNLMAKADYSFGNGAKAFYRYSYFSNSLFATFGLGFSVYNNKDVTRQHAAGIDFNRGSTTHSIRFSYLKFQNQIVDATNGNASLPLSSLGVELSSGSFFSGPNLLAPQSTPQSNRQIRYDGSKIHGSHVIRYGMSFNHIQGGGFANFYGTAPRISWSTNSDTEASAALGPYICKLPSGATSTGANCPLNYPAQRVRWGNGLGFNTLEPALGFPAGGLGPDNRLGLYIGDNWKVKPNFTLTVGLRYDRDTGRTDSDLGAIAPVNAVFPGAGNPVKQPNLNFAPQVGFAWDISRRGKTVIRGGAGLYYENVIWNNVLFDRPFRLKTGAFNGVFSGCFQGQATPITVQGGTITPSNYNPATGKGICGNPYLGGVIPDVLSFWQQVLGGNPLNLQAPNPNYIGNYMSQGLGIPLGWFDPNYKTPRSLQLNIGIQHEIRRGLVFSADYLRNVETRTLLGIDINRVGDVSTFNLGAARAAIADTNASFTNPIGGAPCTTVDCAISAGASMADYAAFGLGVPNDVAGVGCGLPVLDASGNPTGGLGRPCAFGGINATQNQSFLLKPIGRSVYNALQMKLTQNVTNPVKGIKMFNFQASYSLSRFKNSGGIQATGTPGDSDQDFVLQAADNLRPNRYFGPSLLDRTHQISFGGFADVPGGFRIGFISHFFSPLSSGIITPNFGESGEIFRTDFTGDGSFGDPMPGTYLGEFGRGVNASQLTGLINNYNNKYANQPTPAGNLLVANGLMSVAQLQALGGVAPVVCTPPPTSDPNCQNSPGRQVNFTWLRTTDLTLKWRHKFMERLTIEPSVGFYNVFNFSNFNLPPNTINGILFGPGNGSINGTTRQDNESFRVGNGTGVYTLGSARQIEFGMRFEF